MAKQKRKKGIRKGIQTANRRTNNPKNKKTNRKRDRLAHKPKSKKNRRSKGDAPMIGIFCEAFGNTVRNRVIENLLIFDEIGIAIPDLAEESGISKQRAYQIIYDFEKKGYVKKHRLIGKTQLWVINEENPTVKVWNSSLKELMKILANEYAEKYPQSDNHKKKISAK